MATAHAGGLWEGFLRNCLATESRTYTRHYVSGVPSPQEEGGCHRQQNGTGTPTASFAEKGHATVFYVVANAFASPRHDVLHACLQVEFDDRELLERLTYSTSQMQFNGEAVHLGIESGTLPGDITYCRRVVLGCVPQLRDCRVEDAAHVAIRLTYKWMPVITGTLAVGTVCCLDSLHMLMMPAERTSWQTLRSTKTEGALQAPLLLQRCGWATWSRTQRSRR